MADQSDKTEKPTPKKLKETKEEGRTARSRDVTVAVTSLTATAMLVWFGPSMVQRLAVTMSESLSGLGLMASRDLQPEDLTSMVVSHGALIAPAGRPDRDRRGDGQRRDRRGAGRAALRARRR